MLACQFLLLSGCLVLQVWAVVGISQDFVSLRAVLNKSLVINKMVSSVCLEEKEKTSLHLPASIQSEAKYIYHSAFSAGLEPSGEMESWFRSLENLPRSVGVFQQANSTPLPGMGSPRGSAGSDDWAIGAGQAGSSGSSSQPRGSSASKQGMKAAKGVGRYATGLTIAQNQSKGFTVLGCRVYPRVYVKPYFD